MCKQDNVQINNSIKDQEVLIKKKKKKKKATLFLKHMHLKKIEKAILAEGEVYSE